jgi:signal transduction histidine kinase
MSDKGAKLGRLLRAAQAAEEAATGNQRADGIARALLLLWPEASLVGCLLKGPVGDDWAALDGTGRPHADGLAATGPPSACCELGAPSLGRLAVRAADWSGEDDAALELLARRAALALMLERAEAASRRCQEHSELAELAGPVMHEFNNLLNVLGLRLTLIEHDLPPAQASALSRVRARSAEVAELVSRFQAYRRERAGSRHPACLPSLLAQVSRECNVPVKVEPADVPAVVVDELGVRNLLKFLLRFSASHAGGPGPRASLSAEGSWVRLRFETNGPAPQPGADYFRPHPPGQAGATGLELSACRSIVNRAAGRLNANAVGGGRVAILVDLPAAPRTA